MLSLNQIQTISDIAANLWDGFLTKSAAGLIQHSNLSLLDPTQLKMRNGNLVPLTPNIPHPTAIAFLQYCEKEAMTNKSRPAISVVPNVVQSITTSHGPIATDPRNCKSRWTPSGIGVEIQILHPAILGRPDPVGRRLFAKLLLQESGHYVLHRKELIKLCQKNPPLADSGQEEEAWFFCGVIWQLAKAHKAGKDRTLTTIGGAWEVE